MILTINTFLHDDNERLYPYTAEKRDVLGCTFPKTKRLSLSGNLLLYDVRETLRSEEMYNHPIHPDSWQCLLFTHSLNNPSLGMYFLMQTSEGT